ncbi:MAG: hypothetical protein JKY56_22650 [Kofleriaceae bacterium]|nr:hypothetical protein [Kofleriaceae bacterium]
MPGLRLSLILGSLLFFLQSCGGGPQGAQPSWRKRAQPDSEARTPSNVKLSHAAPEYNSLSREQVPDNALIREILKSVEAASVAANTKPPVPDARLFAALGDLAAISPKGGPIPYTFIEFALHRRGIIEPSPNLLIIEGDIDSPESIAEGLTERLSEMLSAGRFARVGIGTRRGSDTDLILLAFQESHLTTRPIARELPRGGSAGIEGVLAPSFSEPHVWHTGADGQVTRLSVSLIGAKGFRALFSCEQETGRQQLEITAEDASGSTVLANFPVWCDERAPTAVPSIGPSSDPPPKSREEAEERMFKMVNQDRAKHGLPALKLDRRLVSVGRKHSDEMLETGHVAHVSPRTGSAGDRVKAGDVRTAVVLENVARAYGVGEAQLGLMNSPGHRANLLSTDVSHVGIGISLGEEVAGRRELLVTQVFILIPRPIDPRKVKRQVVAKIQAVKAMGESGALTQVAQQFANSIASGMPTEEASAIASKSLDANVGNFTRVSTLVTTVSSISSFEPADSLKGDKISYFGLGVAQGNHPVMGDGAIYLVILLGQR